MRFILDLEMRERDIHTHTISKDQWSKCVLFIDSALVIPSGRWDEMNSYLSPRR